MWLPGHRAWPSCTTSEDGSGTQPSYELSQVDVVGLHESPSERLQAVTELPGPKWDEYVALPETTGLEHDVRPPPQWQRDLLETDGRRHLARYEDRFERPATQPDLLFARRERTPEEASGHLLRMSEPLNRCATTYTVPRSRHEASMRSCCLGGVGGPDAVAGSLGGAHGGTSRSRMNNSPQAHPPEMAVRQDYADYAGLCRIARRPTCVTMARTVARPARRRCATHRWCRRSAAASWEPLAHSRPDSP
jgi:hypothetical protein